MLWISNTVLLLDSRDAFYTTIFGENVLNEALIEIFCFIVAGQFVSCAHWFVSFLVVMCVCILHFKEGTKCMPRYVYGSFWCRTGIGWFL